MGFSCCLGLLTQILKNQDYFPAELTAMRKAGIDGRLGTIYAAANFEHVGKHHKQCKESGL